MKRDRYQCAIMKSKMIISLKLTDPRKKDDGFLIAKVGNDVVYRYEREAQYSLIISVILGRERLQLMPRLLSFLRKYSCAHSARC